MSSPHGGDSYDMNTRKRVGKACDRCRLKKSKCDGETPCNRCKQDNTICVFGERKKSQDRVFPKGYVEMIEQQQVSITNGLRVMYQKLVKNGMWEGEILREENGHPLTHDILDRLGVIQSSQPSDSPLRFVDDLDEEREQMLKRNGALVPRRKASQDYASSEEESVGEQRESRYSSIDSSRGTPPLRTSSISSAGSRKRGPDTPKSESTLPTVSTKKMRSSALAQSPSMQHQGALSPLVVVGSPESFDYGYYNMPPDPNTADIDPFNVSSMDYNSTFQPLISPLQADSTFMAMSASLSPDAIFDQDPLYARFMQSGNQNYNSFMSPEQQYQSFAQSI